MRALYNENEKKHPCWNTVDGKVFLRAQVREVYFGVCAEEYPKYEEVLDFLCKKNEKLISKIETHKMGFSETKKRYELVKDGQFNIENEMRRMKKYTVCKK